MKIFKVTLVLLSVLFTFPCFQIKNVDEQNPVNVMAYYMAPREDYRPQDLPLDKLTHIIFSFTVVIDNEMKFEHPGLGEKLSQLVDQKKNHPHLKVMIACGGWGGSEGFSDMAATVETRKKFVDSAIQFLLEYNLDGLDIDWEYPGMYAAGNPYMPEDKQNFTSLMRELRIAMDESGKKLILTFASAGWENYYRYVELEEVMKYADYMNVMTYDAVGGGTPYTAHHTNLGWVKPDDVKDTPAYSIVEERGYDLVPRSAEKIISFCIDKGVDPKQIIIGGAFYGKGWKEVPPNNNGLYQAHRGAWRNVSYATIKEEYENKNGFIRYWDPIAKAAYLYNAEEKLFLSYEDTQSIQLKTQYAIDNGLGGIMFWQLRSDAKKDGLLDAIHEVVKREYE
jgi:chitinase